jgi:hypothetical protein
MKLEQKDFLGGSRNFHDKNKTLPKFRIAASGVKVINTCGYYENFNDLLGNYYCPTLKDLATFLYRMCGQGVQWKLSREISKRTGFNLIKINDTLEDIVCEYANMSDEEAIKDWEESEGFIEREK